MIISKISFTFGLEDSGTGAILSLAFSVVLFSANRLGEEPGKMKRVKQLLRDLR